jgi:cell division protein FtsZ
MIMDAATDTSPKANVCLLGLGGGALRVLERLRPQFENEVDLIGIDTDARELDRVSGIQTLRLGRSLLRGLGCGGDEEMGRLAVDGDRAEIARAITGY